MTYFACGGGCPRGGDHEWDGPGIVFTRTCPDCDDVTDADCPRCTNTGSIETGGAATCSKCGLDAMTDSMLRAP